MTEQGPKPRVGPSRSMTTVPLGWGGEDAPGVPVEVGLSDGRTLSGLATGFAPDAPEFVLWLGSNDAEVDAFARRLVVTAKRAVFVGFLKRPSEPAAEVDAAAVEPLRLHVARDRHIDVHAPPAVEGSSCLRGVPVEADSPFREVYFFRENLVGLERLERLGSILISMGVISREGVDHALTRQAEMRLVAPPAEAAPAEPAAAESAGASAS
ncbi:MAG: hypothetical protein JWM10_1731, partial [Myxococcaceae bacterium]|nr:hypothetical protein [Myxococcaceae bacterium]